MINHHYLQPAIDSPALKPPTSILYGFVWKSPIISPDGHFFLDTDDDLLEKKGSPISQISADLGYFKIVQFVYVENYDYLSTFESCFCLVFWSFLNSWSQSVVGISHCRHLKWELTLWHKLLACVISTASPYVASWKPTTIV